MHSSMGSPQISDEYNKTDWIFESNILKKVSFVISLHFFKRRTYTEDGFLTFCNQMICALFYT